MQFAGSTPLRGVLAAGAVAATIVLAACGGSSAPTSATTSQPPAASSTTTAPQAVAVPVPTCPDTGAAPDGPCNWSQASWAKYLADLGVTPGSPGECLAAAVATSVGFADADAVAKAFAPGTSGKSETDYISQLESRGMDPADALADVSEVQGAQEDADCSSAAGSSQPTTAPVAPSTQPATTTTPSSSVPSGTVSAPAPWTTAQRNAFANAYNADSALKKTVGLSCLMVVVPAQDAAASALRYVGVAWAGSSPSPAQPSPAQPSPAQVKQRLIAKYGAQGAADFNNWPPGAATCKNG